MDNDDYQKIIIKMLYQMDETDIRFLRQIYTLIKRHLDKKKGH